MQVSVASEWLEVGPLFACLHYNNTVKKVFVSFEREENARIESEEHTTPRQLFWIAKNYV